MPLRHTNLTTLCWSPNVVLTTYAPNNLMVLTSTLNVHNFIFHLIFISIHTHHDNFFKIFLNFILFYFFFNDFFTLIGRKANTS